VELEVSLPLGPGLSHPAPHNRLVGIDITVAHRLHKSKIPGEITGVVVIEEQTTDTPGLLTMFQIEVVVAPLLERRIHIVAERLTGIAGGAVPVDAILVESVIGRQIVAATKAVHRLAIFGRSNEEAHIGVGGRYI